MKGNSSMQWPHAREQEAGKEPFPKDRTRQKILYGQRQPYKVSVALWAGIKLVSNSDVIWTLKGAKYGKGPFQAKHSFGSIKVSLFFFCLSEQTSVACCARWEGGFPPPNKEHTPCWCSTLSAVS